MFDISIWRGTTSKYVKILGFRLRHFFQGWLEITCSLVLLLGFRLRHFFQGWLVITCSLVFAVAFGFRMLRSGLVKWLHYLRKKVWKNYTIQWLVLCVFIFFILTFDFILYFIIVQVFLVFKNYFSVCDSISWASFSVIMYL